MTSPLIYSAIIAIGLSGAVGGGYAIIKKLQNDGYKQGITDSAIKSQEALNQALQKSKHWERKYNELSTDMATKLRENSNQYSVWEQWMESIQANCPPEKPLCADWWEGLE